MVGGRLRLAVPGQSDWTASGALDWGFPRSAEGGRRKESGMSVVVSDP